MCIRDRRHHGRTHARILGALASARHLDWMGLLPVERLELRSLRIMSSTEARVDLPLMPPPDAPDRRFTRRAHLRVLSGGLDHA